MQVVREPGHPAVLTESRHIGHTQCEDDTHHEDGRLELVKRETALCCFLHGHYYKGHGNKGLSGPINGLTKPTSGPFLTLRFDLIRT